MSTASEQIAGRVGTIQAAIQSACERAGRAPAEVTLVAVSKTHPASDVLAAIEAGLLHFGENRLEEAQRKMPSVAAQTTQPVQWHMVGRLPTRKLRYALAGFTLLHSLDSLRTAERLSQLAAEQERVQPVLLEVNVSGEATKAGWNAYKWNSNPTLRQTLWAELAQLLTLPGLEVRGLMTMAPIAADPEETRPVFVALRTLRDALAYDFPHANWSELSMGMSDDFPIAIEEGATLVRIGRAIFGARL